MIEARLAILEKDEKPFLSETAVIRENPGQPVASHDLHRPAIGQAVVFIQARFIQAEGIQKRGVTLPQDRHTRISKQGTG
jgi:hypothetical protein